MGQKYSEYIEDCLHRLDLGEDLLDVLAVYPDYQEKLKPLLLVAMASRSYPVPVPNHTSQRLGKNQMLEEMEQLRLQGAFRNSPQIPPGARLMSNLVGVYRSKVVSRLAPSYRLAVVALVLVMSGGFLTLNASAASQPGDILYYLKLGMERVQVALTFNSESNQVYQDQVDDNVEMVTGEEYIAPRTTDRSILVLHGITYQLNQDGRPGVGAVAEAQAEIESSPPAFVNAQSNPGVGNDTPDEGDLEEPDETSEEGNQGKALGKEKSNQGKALGHNKVPTDDKTKDKEKDKDK